MPTATAAAAVDAALALVQSRRLTKLTPHLLRSLADSASNPSKSSAEAAARAAAEKEAADRAATAKEIEADQEAAVSVAARKAARAVAESVPVVARAAGPGPTALLWQAAERKVLVVRKARFGLPTACPTCLPVLLYLRMANVSFDLYVDTSNPNADHIPYIEFGDCVAFNNEEGGIIDFLRDRQIVNLNSNDMATKSVVSISKSLVDAVNYELWLASDGSIANDIYFSDLVWPIRKILHWKRARDVKHQLSLNLNAADFQQQIYKKADDVYDALSRRLLKDEVFLVDNRPTEIDALLLGHVFFVLKALPDTSVLKCTLKKHERLLRYAQRHMYNLLEIQPSENIGNLASGTEEVPKA